MSTLDEFLSEVVMTGYYLAEPPRVSTQHLHDAEMKCLKIIHVFGPLQVHHIAEKMFTTKARATQLTHVLEKHGYIHHRTGSDRRTKLVMVTKKGATVVQEVRKKYMELADSIEATLGPERTNQLCDILRDITPLTMLHEKGDSRLI